MEVQFKYNKTFNSYKDNHKYTRKMLSRGKIFMIDYIIIHNSYTKNVKNTRVRKDAELYTDYYLELTKIKIDTDKLVYKNS